MKDSYATMPSPESIVSPPPPDVLAFLSRVPLFADAQSVQCAPLRGVISLNNTGYRVTVDGIDYFLRFAADTSRFLGVRREEEIEAARAAANVGISPRLLYSEPAGHLLFPFIVGRHWQPEEFHDEANIIRLASTLRRLHDVKGVRAEGSVFRRVERLLASVRTLQLEMPPNLDTHLEAMSRIERLREADTRFRPGLSHNDFWQNNFLDDGEKLWLVDWEFGGNGDGLYDLATISMGGDYSDREQHALLQAYGYTDPEDYQLLQKMKTVVRLFEASWALVMSGLRDSSEYDYLAQSRKMFLSLESSD